MSARFQDAAFLRRVLIVLAVAAATFAVWRLRKVELLLFGAILAGVFFDALAGILARRLRLPGGWALAAAAAASMLMVIMAIAFFGFRFEAQVAELVQGLPPAWRGLRQNLDSTPLGGALVKAVDQLLATPGGQILSHLQAYALTAGVAVMGAILVAVAGLYLAAQPRAYRRGLLHLLAPEERPAAEEFLDVSGAMLRRWLLAQATAMLSVGLATGLSCWACWPPSGSSSRWWASSSHPRPP